MNEREWALLLENERLQDRVRQLEDELANRVSREIQDQSERAARLVQMLCAPGVLDSLARGAKP